MFRSCIVPIMQNGGFRFTTVIFLSPLFFGLGELIDWMTLAAY